MVKNRPNKESFYINGQWVEVKGNDTIAVINPATDQQIALICNANVEDVDNAVLAAKSFSNIAKNLG
jgi:acyl-CoA reductase-like NAD-dependent aldehyde dehydrogenase